MTAAALQRLSPRRAAAAAVKITSRQASSSSHQAVVIGSGPAGITALGNLLDQGIEDVLFVDPKFTGGVFNERWRAVPSNTKGVSLRLHAVFSMDSHGCIAISQNIHRLGQRHRHVSTTDSQDQFTQRHRCYARPRRRARMPAGVPSRCCTYATRPIKK